MSARIQMGPLTGSPAILARWRTWRKLLFVAANLAIVTASCVLFRYLSSGNWLEFTQKAYLEDLSYPLAGVLARPLGAISYPWMILVYGMLLAIVLIIPPMMAALYGLRYVLPFLLVVALFGHAPVLAVALAIGCVMASRTPIKTEMPSFAAPLGLTPAVVYLCLFGFPDSLTAEVVPLQRWVLACPMLLGVISAALTGILAVKLAGAAGYRAGVIWPWALLLLAGAGSVFYSEVGPDELEYAFITEKIADGDLIFHPKKLRSWTREHHAQGLHADNLVTRLRDDMRLRRNSLAKRCEQFLTRYSDSDRSPELLWLVGQCRSLQLDIPGLAAGVVRYSASWPSENSEISSLRLIEQFPAAPQSALAEWRIGQLALRRGDIDQAYRRLQAAIQILLPFVDKKAAPVSGRDDASVFRPRPSIPSIEYYVEALFQVRRLTWMIEKNTSNQEAMSGEALSEMLKVNPHELHLDEKLGALLDKRPYESSSIGDNLKLAVAVATEDPYLQADMLALLAADERTDAAIEANYHLGMLTMQTARARALMLLPGIKTPQEYFATVIAAPENPWQELARRHLLRIRPKGGD